MAEPTRVTVPGQLSIARLERLADLVFAFAILIMVGDIVLLVEDYGTHERGWAYIRQDFDAASAFLLNAVIIGYYWITHQKHFSYYQRTNEIHAALEILFLIVIISMPFGNYIMALDNDGLTPIFLVSVDIFLASVFMGASWWYATKGARLTSPGEPDDETRAANLREAAIVAFTAIVSVLLALIHPALWLPAFVIVPMLLKALKLA